MKKLLFTLIFLLIAQSSFADTESHYVTQAGAGAQNGESWATAWSIADLNTAGNWDTDADDDGKIGPDDVVYVDGTITTRILVAGSGNSSNRIAFNLATAVFNGNGTQLEAIHSESKNYLNFLGGEFTGTYTTQGMVFNSNKYLTLDGFYMHDIVTATVGLKIQAKSALDSDHVEILNTRFKDLITNNTWAIQISVSTWASGAEDGTVHDFNIQYFDMQNVYGGIQFYGTQANVFHSGDKTDNHSPYNFYIRDGKIDGTKYYAVTFSCGCQKKTNDNYIQRSRFLNIGDITIGAVNAIGGMFDNLIIEHNEISNVQTSSADALGIIFDRAYSSDTFLTENAVARFNYIHGCKITNGGGISFWKASGCGAYGNILDDNYSAIRNQNAQSVNNMVYDNTINGSDAYDIYISAGSLTSKNNIINGTPATAHVLVATGATLTSDYNDFYPDTGTLFSYNETAYNFSDWKTNSSQDAHSISSDPIFVNASGGDFRLLGSSPAIDKGVDVGLTFDYRGTKVPRGSTPDMGALEYWPKIYFPPSKLYTNPIDIRRLSFEPY